MGKFRSELIESMKQAVAHAVGRKVSRMRVTKALAILKRAGVGNPPMKGDKLRRGKKRA